VIYLKHEVTIHTLPHLKCISLFSLRSSVSSISMGVRIELPFTNIHFVAWVIRGCFHSQENRGENSCKSVILFLFSEIGSIVYISVVKMPSLKREQIPHAFPEQPLSCQHK